MQTLLLLIQRKNIAHRTAKGVCNFTGFQCCSFLPFILILSCKMEMHTILTTASYRTQTHSHKICDIDFIAHRLPNKIQMCTFFVWRSARPICSTELFLSVSFLFKPECKIRIFLDYRNSLKEFFHVL